jgi:CBS domain-containing protein
MHVDPTRGWVRDVMTKHAITIPTDTPLADTADLLDRFTISGLPVVDSVGRVVGVVTETDLLRVRTTDLLWARWPDLTAADVMTKPALTVTDDARIEEAAQHMNAFAVHRLVVVDDHAMPIGIISAGDLVRAMAGRVDR